MESPFYVELLSSSLNSYELKKFRVQHDETQLTNYLCKIAKKHQKENLNKIYLVRQRTSDSLVAWFALKAATLPYNDKDEVFLTPAIEMTHFAVDERYKAISDDEDSMKTGEFIFWNHILETAKEAAQKIACKDLFIFAIDTPKLVNYYKTRLCFRELENIEDKNFFEYAEPDYDDGCKFMFFPLS